MSTLGDVMNEVRYLLRSYTGQHERTTYLTNSTTGADLTLAVADGTVVDQGLVEIDDEILYVESSDAGSVTIPPFGRGYMGSAAAAHTANTQVIVDPYFPKQAIKDAVNHALLSMYPRVYAVDATELTMIAGVTSYELPAEVDRIISASWQVPGATGYWRPVKRWRADNEASTAAFATGKAIHIADPIPSGRTVRVVYAKKFVDFVDSSSTFDTSGLLESMRDVLVYGAAWRLVQFLEVAREDLDSVQNQERSKYAPAGTASALAARILSLYERRIEEERDRLRQLYPMSIRFTR